MRDWLALIAGAAGAAVTMYYFDPDLGRRRRAMLRQSLVGASHDARRAAGGEVAYAISRARGVLAEFERSAPHGDAQLRDRIRSRLGRLVSHPRAIDVQVDDGAVRLSGHVLAKELDGLLLQVRDMQGVKRVINAMSAHDDPREIARQSGAQRSEEAHEEEARAHPT